MFDRIYPMAEQTNDDFPRHPDAWWLEPSSPKFGLNPTSINHGVRLEYPRISSRKIYCPLSADDRFEHGSPAFASKRPTWKVSDRIGTMNQSTETPRGHSHVYWRRQLDSSCGLHREWVHMCVIISPNVLFPALTLSSITMVLNPVNNYIR